MAFSNFLPFPVSLYVRGPVSEKRRKEKINHIGGQRDLYQADFAILMVCLSLHFTPHFLFAVLVITGISVLKKTSQF